MKLTHPSSSTPNLVCLAKTISPVRNSYLQLLLTFSENLCPYSKLIPAVQKKSSDDNFVWIRHLMVIDMAGAITTVVAKNWFTANTPVSTSHNNASLP